VRDGDIPLKPEELEAGRDLLPEICACAHLPALEDVSCRETRLEAQGEGPPVRWSESPSPPSGTDSCLGLGGPSGLSGLPRLSWERPPVPGHQGQIAIHVVSVAVHDRMLRSFARTLRPAAAGVPMPSSFDRVWRLI